VNVRRDGLPHLSSEELLAVVAVAHYRSFLAASVSLKMSQPTMTRIVKRVENELGVPLFIRNTRHVSVTEAGREFAAVAQRMLNDLKINVAHLRGLVDQPQGHIVVSSVFSLADAILPPLMGEFRKRFPGIELHLREGLHGAVRDDVRSGLADFGIGYIEEAAEPFATELLRDDGFHVVAPRHHAFARRRTVPIQALASIPLVSFPPESLTRRIVDHAAVRAGVALKYVMTANRLPTLHGLVRNGIGLAILPERERPVDDAGLISRPLAGQGLSRKIGIIRLRERELSAAAERFADVIRRWICTPRSAGKKRLAR
jgi:DNA-binding transcriptional LysR family regulator